MHHLPLSVFCVTRHLAASRTHTQLLSNLLYHNSPTSPPSYSTSNRSYEAEILLSPTMRLTIPHTSSHIGNLGVMHETKVVGLDAGEHTTSDGETVGVPHSALAEIHRQMVIIVPCKDEPPETIEGVLCGIPAACLILLVSNSDRDAECDGFQAEVDMLDRFCRYSHRRAMAVHQKDPAASAAIRNAGMPELIGNDGTVRNGKGEGMILGLAVVAALLPEMRYVGFVDADCKIPGSPHEYCRAYAAGFASSPHSDDDHIMVRLRWAAKPKVRNGRVDFTVTEGRSSRVVNAWMNRVLGLLWERTETNGLPATIDCERIISTANAGEHALTMSLALKMRMAGGYAIEPFHFVDLIERQLRSPSLTPSTSVSSNQSVLTESSINTLDMTPIRILQIRTINPHMHTETDDDHIHNMWKAGLGTMYHHLLPLCAVDDHLSESVSDLRREMLDFVKEQDRLVEGRKPQVLGASAAQPIQGPFSHEIVPRPRVYPPLETLDLAMLQQVLNRSGWCESLRRIGEGWRHVSKP